MQSWPNRPAARLATLSLTVVGVAYPFMYYFLNQRVHPQAFGILACLLLLARMWSGGDWVRLLRWPMAAAIVAIALLALLDADLSAKAYPSVTSWAIALLFAQSLTTPTSLVERFATLRGKVLPPEGRAYCRKVSLVWAIWLSLNGVIAALLAWRGELAAWTLWTGILSYAISGALFAGEFALRRWRRPTAGTS